MNKATIATMAYLGLAVALKIENKSNQSVQNMPEVNMYEDEKLKSLAGQFALVAEESDYCFDEQISDSFDYNSEWCELWRGGAMTYYGNVLKSLTQTTLCTSDIFENACALFDLEAPTYSEDLLQRNY